MRRVGCPSPAAQPVSPLMWSLPLTAAGTAMVVDAEGLVDQCARLSDAQLAELRLHSLHHIVAHCVGAVPVVLGDTDARLRLRGLAKEV